MTSNEINKFKREEKEFRGRIVKFLSSQSPLDSDIAVLALMNIAATLAQLSKKDIQTFTITAMNVWMDRLRVIAPKKKKVKK